MRLIDANALRKEFAKSPWFAGENGAMLSYARTIIDNAPTVERVINMYPKGEVIVQNTRPQGEWIKGKEIARRTICNKEFIEYRDFTCSNCRITLDNLLYWDDGSPVYKYCPNCGAKMQNGD